MPACIVAGSASYAGAFVAWVVEDEIQGIEAANRGELKPFLAPLKLDADNELPAVVFSTHGLQITTVEYSSKDQNTKKRRTSSRWEGGLRFRRVVY